MRIHRRGLVPAIAAAALLAGGGTALAQQAPASGDRQARCEARLAKIAERRGVSVAEFEAQVTARLAARIDAAERAGRISAERAQAMKARLAQAELCPAARPATARVVLGKPRMFRAAAAYLELRPAELRRELRGTSLAAIAEERGKSVAGLREAMLAPAEARLDRAVATGRIGQARADRALERLEAVVARLVAKVFPAG